MWGWLLHGNYCGSGWSKWVGSGDPRSIRICLIAPANLSMSVFSVDFGYLRKKIRVIVIRDMLIEVAYDPNCAFKDKLNLLLHVAAETPLRRRFELAQAKYKSKLTWNLLWILIPIYATTPVLAVFIYVLHGRMMDHPC